MHLRLGESVKRAVVCCYEYTVYTLDDKDVKIVQQVRICDILTLETTLKVAT